MWFLLMRLPLLMLQFVAKPAVSAAVVMAAVDGASNGAAACSLGK